MYTPACNVTVSLNTLWARLANKPNQIRIYISAHQQLEHLSSSTRTNSKHGNQRRQTFLQITRKDHSSRVRKNNGDALKLMMASSIARKHLQQKQPNNRTRHTRMRKPKATTQRKKKNQDPKQFLSIGSRSNIKIN